MKLKIKQIIFTDKTKEWLPLIRNGKSFYMFHIQTEDGRWISKFFNKKEENPSSKLKVWEEYEINFKVNWQYNNLLSVYDLKWNLIF